MADQNPSSVSELRAMIERGAHKQEHAETPVPDAAKLQEAFKHFAPEKHASTGHSDPLGPNADPFAKQQYMQRLEHVLHPGGSEMRDPLGPKELEKLKSLVTHDPNAMTDHVSSGLAAGKMRDKGGHTPA